MKHETRETLIRLYHTAGKHGQYQILSPMIQEILGLAFQPSKPRFEKERFRFIVEHCQIKNKKVLDIGGNAGFFTFEMV